MQKKPANNNQESPLLDRDDVMLPESFRLALDDPHGDVCPRSSGQKAKNTKHQKPDYLQLV